MNSMTNRRSLLKAAVVVGAGAAVVPALRLLSDERPAATAVPRAGVGAASPFKHPGMLHTQSDFERMATGVKAGAEPYNAGWGRLVANGRSRST
jgi:hypothetical protein